MNEKRRAGLYITRNGESLTISDWARRHGKNPDTVQQRFRKLGWSFERALTQPVAPTFRKPVAQTPLGDEINGLLLTIARSEDPGSRLKAIEMLIQRGF